MNETSNFDKLSLLYQENAKVAAIFWEWRHKILTYFFTAIGALFVLAGWLYHQHPARFMSAPFFLGFILSIASFLLDRRNEAILNRCYKVGGNIEVQLLWAAIFAFIGAAHDKSEPTQRRITYSRTIQATYLIVGILLLTLSILNLFVPLRKYM